MHYLIRTPEIGKEPHPEKSKLRRDIVDVLRSSIEQPSIEVSVGRIYLETERDVTDVLARIHGISSFSPCIRCPIEELTPRVVAVAKEILPGKLRFAVKVKRVGDHPFTSKAKAAELGSAVIDALPHLAVDLKAPDETIHVEIRGEGCYVFTAILKGVDAGSSAREVLTEPRFLVDAMLGTLASRLRALGFDTECHHDTADSFLLRKSAMDRRLLLTQDRELARLGGPNAYLVAGKALDEQLDEVIGRFGLTLSEDALFTRCSVCNAVLERIPKDAVEAEVPPRAAALYEEFYRCPGCAKVYWKGSHYDQMREELFRGGRAANASRRRTTMADRDVERGCSKDDFVATLRRLADALERGEPFRIQVAGKRFTVPTGPAGAELVIEHEAEGGEEELALELHWKTQAE